MTGGGAFEGGGDGEGGLEGPAPVTARGKPSPPRGPPFGDCALITSAAIVLGCRGGGLLTRCAGGALTGISEVGEVPSGTYGGGAALNFLAGTGTGGGGSVDTKPTID